jgi:hypothetical protein
MPVQIAGGQNVLRDDRAYLGLTPKQYAYCEARARGMGVTEAYKHAYQPKDTIPQNSLYVVACETEANIKVQARIRARLLELQGDTSGLPVIGRDFVITGIASLAIGGQKESTRLKGYELLGKALGLFDRGPETIEKPKTVNDVDEKLRQLLRATMANPGPVIDAELINPDLRADAPMGPDTRGPDAAPDDGPGPDDE